MKNRRPSLSINFLATVFFAVFIFNFTFAKGLPDCGLSGICYYRVGANNSYGISYSNEVSINVNPITCNNGDKRNCALQAGVCQGSQETCTGGEWPGCSAANYGTNYEAVETKCGDGLDNDCDSLSDSSDSDCPVVDTTPPSFSNIQNTSIHNNSAVISWDTNENARGRVGYGTSAGSLDLNTLMESSFLIGHIVNLEGLSADTIYYYNAESCDAAGNCANSSIFEFKTLANDVPFVDIWGPIIKLNKPDNGYSSSAKDVKFNYTIIDDFLISNCTFYLYSIGGQTQTRIDFNLISGNDKVFILTSLENKDYVWNISCYDALGNLGVSSESRTLKINYVALPPVDTGTGSGTGSSTGSGGLPPRPTPTAENVSKNISSGGEKIIIGGDLSYVNVGKDGEEKVLFDLYGNSYTISFVLEADGSVMARLLNGNYLISREEVLPIKVGMGEIYVGIVDSTEDNARVVIGLDANVVKEQIRKTGGEESSDISAKVFKTVYYALMGVVVVLIGVIIVLAVLYFFKARKEGVVNIKKVKKAV